MTRQDIDMGEARKLAARLLCFGFDGFEVNDHARQMIALGAGSVIIFGRNIQGPRQVASLCADLKRAAAPNPLIVMVDQEGGRVARLREPSFTEVPSAARIGEAPDGVSAAAAAGYIFGRELRACNIDMDLAPCMDVNTNPRNRVIGDRSYGATPAAVSAMGAAFITALQQQGVAACAKHWPGHGDTTEDSHDTLPALPHDIARLKSVEMKPFEAALLAGVASVLVAHLLVPGMEPPGAPSVPASCSAAVVGYLRRDLGFDGVVMTDDMEMGALKAYSLSRAAVQGVAAGIDMFLVCHTAALQLEVVDAIAGALVRGELTREQMAAAAGRIERCCTRFCAPAPPGTGAPPDSAALVGTAAHKARMRAALTARL